VEAKVSSRVRVSELYQADFAEILMHRSVEPRRLGSGAYVELLEDRNRPKESNHPPGRISSYRQHRSVYRWGNSSLLFQKASGPDWQIVNRSSIPEVMPRSIAFGDAAEEHAI
jgi:hypothetical protein